jgi:hypothetical protein
MSIELADILVLDPTATGRGRQNVPLLAALLALICAAALAKGSPSVHQLQTEAAGGLTSSQWKVRSEAVRRLTEAPLDSISAGTRQALISLLQKETKALWTKLQGTSIRGYPPQGVTGEGWAEYYASLVQLVVKLRDPTANAALVAAVSGPGSRLNEWLASLGPAVVGLVGRRLHWLSSVRVREPGFEGVQYEAEVGLLDVLARVVLSTRSGNVGRPLSNSDLANIRGAVQPLLRSTNPWAATRAARTLAIVAAPQDQERVREVFARLLKDPDHNRREIALSAMRDITDSRFVPIDQLKLVAGQDAFRLAGPTAHYPAGAYPLRHEAAQILKSLDEAQ